MATTVTFGDLARDPGEVARGLVAWVRGDPAEAVVQTLAASGRELTNKRYTLWIWEGRTAAAETAWALPVTAAEATAFSPRGPATVLLRCLDTAAELGGDPALMRLEDWRGHVCLVAPGLIEGPLADDFVAEEHPPPDRARLVALPRDLPLGGPPIPLPDGDGWRGGAVAEIAARLAAHPVRVALALLAHRVPLTDFAADPSSYLGRLRGWGVVGDLRAPGPPPPSLAIADDPCPRRRHARTVLQRLLRMGKVGPGYHTEISHFSRGAAVHERHQAHEVAEALLRAGLLGEKPSVGQRHIHLNVKALPDIHALIDRGETRDPQLAALWTAPAPGDAPTEPREPSP
jgi:hypothetical protein